MNKILNALLCALLTLFLSACSGEKHHLALDGASIATSFDASARTFRVSENEKPVILFFFTSACGACAEQAPILNKIYADGDALIIGVLGDGRDLESDIKTAQSKGVKFPVLSAPNSVKYLSNIAGGIFGTPTSVIFASDGKMRNKLIGLYPKSAFTSEISGAK